MLRGVRIGVDVGTVRVGVAASDPEGLIAFPVTTYPRSDVTANQISELVQEREAVAIFVGLPKHMNGSEGASAADARSFAAELSELVAVPVRLVDERLTTTSAAKAMSNAGKSAKRQRESIDAAAAAIILEVALDIDRNGNLSTVTVEVPRKEKHE